MGLGIAQVFASAGFVVLASDLQPATRAKAMTQLGSDLAARVASGKLTAAARDATLTRLHIVEDLAGLAPASLLIEAIVERLDAKQALFASLEAVVSPQAILASNTSSIPVAEVARGLTVPQRVLGLHFFNPAPVMKLVELIPHAGTLVQHLRFARHITETTGKIVIQCPDRPGFIVNRCARPYYGEALALLEEGRSASEIDAAMQAAGYRLGPFSLIDLIGADINLAATVGLHAAMRQHPRYHPFAALRAQVACGKLGRKSGAGFIFPATVGPVPTDAAAISLRIDACLINEAAWLLAEGGSADADIDTALKLGLNFPHGPFAALALHGKARILTTLAALERRAPPHLKTRYLPAPALEAA